MAPHFTLFRVPVRVDGWFWLSALLLGYIQRYSPVEIALWVAVMFVGVLAHEMGHALLAQRFGLPVEVHLVAMGGLTRFPAGRLTHLRSFFVSGAGPAVGIVIGSICLAIDLTSPGLSELVRSVLWMAIFVNLGWAIFNLLPIVGLDGGNMMAALFDKFFGPRGQRAALLISILVACAVIAIGLATRSIWLVFLMGLLALQNYRAWQMASQWHETMRDRARMPVREREPAERSGPPIDGDLRSAWQALEEGDARTVRRLAESMVSRARDDQERFEVAHLLAWGKLLTGDPDGAAQALRFLPAGKLPDALLEGAILLELGRPAQAVRPLAEAIIGRNDDFVAMRLARAVAGSAKVDEVLSILGDPEKSEQVGARALQLVVHETFYAGHHDAAARVGERLFERFGQANDAFNVACALGQAGRAGEALPWLERAIDAGLSDPSVLDSDADLAPLRALPAWKDVRARAGLA